MSLTLFEFFLQLPLVLKLLSGFLVLGVAIEVLGVLYSIKFSFDKVEPLDKSGKLPGVSIIKPCREANDNEEELFDAFFNQDYPGYVELLFVIGDESHPIVPIVKKYLAKYPEGNPLRSARIVYSSTRDACSPKINSLYDGHVAAKGDIIVWSDSDVIINANYVTELVAALQQPGAGLVTIPQYDARANTFGAAYKVLANNADLASFVMSYAALNRRKRIAWGHSSAFWKAQFDAIPNGWKILFNSLADDLGLPMIMDDNDHRVVFRNIYCPVETSNKTVAQMFEQKKRWVMCQRMVIKNRWLYLSGMLFYPQIASLILMLGTGFSEWGIAIFFAMAAGRIFVSALWEALFLKSLKMNLKYFWTIILWDLSQIYFFWHGFSTNSIKFRGTSYRVLDDYSLSR